MAAVEEAVAVETGEVPDEVAAFIVREVVGLFLT
jgi:hypothetical protein